jgi:hypothetical protein
LRWLALHWGDVVPAWLAVIVAAYFGIQACLSSRGSKAAEREAKKQDRATVAAEGPGLRANCRLLDGPARVRNG